MSEPTPIEVLNHCIENDPLALKIYAFGPRVRKVRFVTRLGLPSIEVDENDVRLRTKHRTAVVLAEFPEEVGEGLKGPAETHDYMVLFAVSREAYDALLRQRATGLVLPPGVRM